MTEEKPAVALMSEEHRKDVARELDIIAEVQRMAVKRLHEAAQTYRQDNYLTYDLEDAVRMGEAARMKLDEIHRQLMSPEGYRY